MSERKGLQIVHNQDRGPETTNIVSTRPAMFTEEFDNVRVQFEFVPDENGSRTYPIHKPGLAIPVPTRGDLKVKVKVYRAEPVQIGVASCRVGYHTHIPFEGTETVAQLCEKVGIAAGACAEELNHKNPEDNVTESEKARAGKEAMRALLSRQKRIAFTGDPNR